MDKSFAIMLILLLLVASCYLTRLQASNASKTIVVPDDYATLEAAVQQASPGDTVYVRAGRHKISKDTLIINKALSIIGEDAASTVLIGPGYGYEFFPYPSRTEADSRVSTLLSGGTVPANFIPPSKVAIQVNADNFQISHVTIEKCDVGITVYGNGTILTDTKMPSASITGSNALISDNVISSISVNGDHQRIMRNQGYINLGGSYNVVVENGAGSDMSLSGSFNVIAGNNFSTVYMGNAHSNLICNNSLGCLWVGFDGQCSNNTVVKNRLTGPGLWGILMGAGSYNIFHENLICNYTGEYSGYGIAIGGYGQIAERNLFYRNILINNNRHVSTNWEVLGAGTLWDNGKEGNYWDDYNGADADGDGIGDTSYIVRGVVWNESAGGHVSFVFGRDNYPLMFPFDVDSVQMELPEWALRMLYLSYELPNPSPSLSATAEPTPILEPQQKEPFSITWVVIAISAAVVGVGIIYHFKKSRKLPRLN
ncbi:MAG: hypothetical protein QXD70_01825 [Candidatus Bathyarchaeia archaeon]